VDTIITLIRFLFGVIAAGILVAFLAIWFWVPWWVGITIPLATGVLAMVVGDRFLRGFIRSFRWLQ